jgi:hypothetical protein
MPSITSSEKMISLLEKSNPQDCMTSYLNMKLRMEDLVEISTLCSELGVSDTFTNNEVQILYYMLLQTSNPDSLRKVTKALEYSIRSIRDLSQILEVLELVNCVTGLKLDVVDLIVSLIQKMSELNISDDGLAANCLDLVL